MIHKQATRLTLVLITLSILPRVSRSDGLIFQLPAEGVWARYQEHTRVESTLPELFMSDLLRGRKSIRGFVMPHNSASTYCFNTPAGELLAFLATNVLTTSRDDLHE